MVFDDSITVLGWLQNSAIYFIILAGIVAAIGLIFSYLVATLQYGPSEAFYFVSRIVFQIVPDFVRTSFGRIFALAKLSIQETIRKKVIFVAFAIFAALLLGGGWFLNMNTRHPDQVYIGFVYFGTQLLVGLFGLLIASFSLPTDIKSRTIYTVVTKPVRSSEIVIGRVLGFGFVGTIMLLLIWVASYLFVERGLNHRHEISDVTFTKIEKRGESSISGGRTSMSAEYEGRSGVASNHWHLIEVTSEKTAAGDPAGLVNIQVPAQNGGHAHDLIVESSEAGGYRGPINNPENKLIRARVEDGKLVVFNTETGAEVEHYIGPPTGILMARERIGADSLAFHDRRGMEKSQGVNVGNEWEHRSYIAGGSSSLARAIYQFKNFTANRFSNSDSIQLDLNNMSVVRTHKGIIEKGVTGAIEIRSTTDEYEYQTSEISFEADEFAIKTLSIDRLQKNCIRKKLILSDDDEPEEIVGDFDLFDDIAANGEIEIRLRCNETGQFFGIAKNDLYFLTNEGSFALNFAKAYFGIWLQMMVIIAASVMFSTFLSGIVSMVAVLSIIVLGCFGDTITELRKGVMGEDGAMPGGGPLESVFRIYTQQNQVTPMDEGITKTVIKSIDTAFMNTVEYLTWLVPDFTRMDFSEPLVAGFNINLSVFTIATILTGVFVFMTVIVGYFVLKTREIAK